MRYLSLVIVLLVLGGLALPAAAADTNRVGYVTFQEVRILLTGTNARVEVDYTLDPGVHLMLILFGTGDLQKKIERALNFPSLKAGEVGPGHAVFTLEDAAESYGDRAYWFPAHEFGVAFPRVEVEAPGYSRSFSTARSIPRGLGYFGDLP
jgi:hypothetical protein